ncbi:MAG: hypothetical protein ACRC0A_01935 [Chitinophagaceae bacterium]
MKKISLFIVALIFIMSCSSVSLLYTWKEGYNQLDYKNILVLSVSERKSYNYFAKMLEEGVVSELQTKSIKAFGVSRTQLVGTQFPDSAQLNTLAKANNCDAILIIDLQDSRIERTVSPGMFGGGYFGWGFGMGIPITYDDNILYFETRLIDLKNQNIVYLFNNSINYNYSNPKSSVNQLSMAIVNQLYPSISSQKKGKEIKLF